jgi:ATP-binding protein involved in chromosome partitioning
MAEKYGVQLLGEIPLDIRIRESMDAGKPIVIADPESKISAVYREIARKVGVAIAGRNKDYTARMPSIKVSNS